MGYHSSIQIRKFQDYSNNSQEFFIRSIKEIRGRAGKNLTIPKKLEFYKIVYVTHGQGMHRVDFRNVKLKENELLFINSNTVQCFSDAENMEGFAIHFSRDFFLRERENFKYIIKLNKLTGPTAIACMPQTAIMLDMLKKTYDTVNDEERFEQVMNYLRIILFDVQLKCQKMVSQPKMSHEKLFEKFQNILNKTISYQTKVADVCQHLKTDSKRLNQSLRKNAGKSAKELLDERLILEIKRLLLYSNLTAKEIAYKLKFDEPANMANYFKRHTLQTPIQFRDNTQSAE